MYSKLHICYKNDAYICFIKRTMNLGKVELCREHKQNIKLNTIDNEHNAINRNSYSTRLLSTVNP